MNRKIDIIFENNPLNNSSLKKEIEIIKSIKKSYQYVIYDSKYINEYLFKELSKFIRVIFLNDSLISYENVYLNLFQRYYSQKRLPNSNYKYKDLLIISNEIRTILEPKFRILKKEKY